MHYFDKHGTLNICQVLILTFLGCQLALCHVHMYYDNSDNNHNNHVIGYNNDGNYSSDYGHDGGYSADEGANENGEDEETKHSNQRNYFFLGHPTGVAVHPMNIMHHQPFNISEQKSDDKVTDILHGLLAKYDNRIRPMSPDNATMITVAILDFQVVGVDESKSEFSSTVLLQQMWFDPRLVYDLRGEISDVPYITISHDHTRELWLPDTFFINEKKAQIHEMTMTNDAILLFSNGSVVRSTRITVSTYCPFSYRNFPFESQQCEMLIGSHGYGDTDIVLYWDEGYVIKAITPDLTSSWRNVVSEVHTGKFLVTSLRFDERSEKFNLGKKSRLSLIISLQRAWKPFVIRFYLPMALFVFVSLGTLFLNDFKVALILNLFNLAFINIFIAIRSASDDDTPRTSTRTSFDIYFIICLTYILLAVLITVYKLLKLTHQSKARPLSGARPMQLQSSFAAEGRSSSNRRRQAEQLDIFNPNRDEESTATAGTSQQPHHHHFHNGSGNDGESSCDHEGGGNDGEYERIYQSPSYPLHLSSRTRVVLRKTGRFMLWLGKYLRWILLISFLITDYSYFKTYAVQNS